MFLDLPGLSLGLVFFCIILRNTSGIIQNAEPDVVQLVEEMVVSHIRGNCLILVALPMTGNSIYTNSFCFKKLTDF